MRLVKFIWDFRGDDAKETAEHHAEHLIEFAEGKELDVQQIGYEVFGEYYAISFMMVPEVDMIEYRDLLKPHRGEVFGG